MKPELIPIRELASGAELELSVFRFRGKAHGPKAYFQASLHGSEVQGNWVIAELLERLPGIEILGDITLVPCANPHAQNTKLGEYTMGRYDPVDGDNWNRTFFDFSSLADSLPLEWPAAKTELRSKLLDALRDPPKPEAYARRLSRTLQRLAAEHDFILDLHCASHCETHAYVPAYAMGSFPLLPCRHALRMENNKFGGAMDEGSFIAWARLGERFAKRDGAFPQGLPEAYTLELAMHDTSDLALAKRQAEMLLHFLAEKGVIRGKFRPMEFPSRYVCDLKDYETFYAASSGFFHVMAKMGEVLEAGSPFYQYLRFQPFAREVVGAPERLVPITITNSSSVHSGTKLGKYMRNPQPLA